MSYVQNSKTAYGFIKDNYIGKVTSVSELSKHTKINKEDLEKAFEDETLMTPQTALRMEAVLGVSAETLLHIQLKSTLYFKRERLKTFLSTLEPINKE